MTLSVKPKFDSMVDEALAFEPVSDTYLREEIDRGLFENSRADALFDVVPAASLQNNGVNPVQVQQMAEHEPCRAGSDNPHLGAPRLLHSPP
jgi:hypothetical protein